MVELHPFDPKEHRTSCHDDDDDDDVQARVHIQGCFSRRYLRRAVVHHGYHEICFQKEKKKRERKRERERLCRRAHPPLPRQTFYSAQSIEQQNSGKKERVIDIYTALDIYVYICTSVCIRSHVRETSNDMDTNIYSTLRIDTHVTSGRVGSGRVGVGSSLLASLSGKNSVNIHCKHLRVRKLPHKGSVAPWKAL